MARVLIVDDEPVMRELIKVTLEDAGHAVESVESGRAALELLAQHAYDLIVCDLMARRSTVRSSGGRHPGRRSCSSRAMPMAAPTRSSSGPRRRR